MTWDPNSVNYRLYFDDMPNNVNLSFMFYGNWFEDLKIQFDEKKRYISLTVVSQSNFVTKDNIKIINGSKIQIFFWKSFFKKWEECLDRPFKINANSPLIVVVNKKNQRKWRIGKLEQLDII